MYNCALYSQYNDHFNNACYINNLTIIVIITKKYTLSSFRRNTTCHFVLCESKNSFINRIYKKDKVGYFDYVLKAYLFGGWCICT